MGNRINTVMQPCFFQLARDPARGRGDRPHQGVRREDVRQARDRRSSPRTSPRSTNRWPASPTCRSAGQTNDLPGTIPPMPDDVPDFVARFTSRLMAGDGDMLPVSALPVDGTFPSGTTQYEKRGDRPDDPDLGPGDLHRLRQVRHGLPARDDPDEGLPGGRGRETAPASFLHKEFKSRDLVGHRLTIQVAPDDCTGCGVCVDVCPAKSKTDVSHKAINMEPILEHRDVERERWDFFQSIAPLDRSLDRPRHDQGHARCSSRCSSSPAPAAAAARRRTSGWSASCSATG